MFRRWYFFWYFFDQKLHHFLHLFHPILFFLSCHPNKKERYSVTLCGHSACYFYRNQFSLSFLVGQVERCRDSHCMFFTGFFTFLIFSNILQKEDDIYLFLKFIVIAACLNALFGIFQGIFGYKFITSYGFSAHGTLYNPNPFSSFLGIVYPIAILLFIKGGRIYGFLQYFLSFLQTFLVYQEWGSLQSSSSLHCLAIFI